MKTVLKLGLWVLSIVFAYLIYLSVNAPIEFKKIKQERFAEVISVMKDIRNSQEAYKTVKGEFAKDFNSLIQLLTPLVTRLLSNVILHFTNSIKCIRLIC